jgi:flagellar hook-associated protein 3 FlgL
MIGTNYRLTMETNRQAALSRSIARLQTEISTTRRIQAPSDDPVAAARISEIGRTQANQASFKSNLDLANALASGAETALEATANAVTRAHELMIAGANGTLSGTNRAAMALELRSIAAEITTLKDSRDARGNRLFMPGWALQIPVAAGLTINAAGTREEVFEAVPTAGGPRDLATIVADAATALEGGGTTAIGGSVTELVAGVDHIAGIRGQQGARGNRIDQLVERFEATKLQLTEERSVLEDTDVHAAIAKLQSQQLTLDAAQAVFARVNQSTLFDVLR